MNPRVNSWDTRYTSAIQLTTILIPKNIVTFKQRLKSHWTTPTDNIEEC